MPNIFFEPYRRKTTPSQNENLCIFLHNVFQGGQLQIKIIVCRLLCDNPPNDIIQVKLN